MSAQNFEQMINLYHGMKLYCAIGALVFLALAVFLFFWLKIPSVFGELTGRTAQKAINEMTAESATSGSLTSMKVGADGRRYRRGKTGALLTGRLHKNSGRLNDSFRTGGLGTTSQPQMSNSSAAPFVQQMPQSGGMSAYTQPTEPMNGYGNQPTAPMSGYGNQPTAPMNGYGSQPTDVLDNYGSQPTDVLDSYGSQPTDVLDSYGSQPTDVLDSYGSQPTDVSKHYDADITAKMDGTAPVGSGDTSVPVYQEPMSETMVLSQNTMTTGANVFVIERSIVEIHTDEVI